MSALDQQLSLDGYSEALARRARDHGTDGALWASSEWAQAAQLVLEDLIASGQSFTSEDIRLVVGPPPSPSALGALLLRASKAGRIECVGFEQSKRPSRHAGMLRRWRGSP